MKSGHVCEQLGNAFDFVVVEDEDAEGKAEERGGKFG